MELRSAEFNQATVLKPIEFDESTLEFTGAVKSVELNSVVAGNAAHNLDVDFERLPNSRQKKAFKPADPQNVILLTCLNTPYHQGEQFYAMCKQFGDSLPPGSNFRILMSAVPYALNYYLRDLVSTDRELPDFGDDDYPSMHDGSNPSSGEVSPSVSPPRSPNQSRKLHEIKLIRDFGLSEQEKLERIKRHSMHPKYQNEVEENFQKWFSNPFVQAAIAYLQRKGITVVMDRIKFYYERADFQGHYKQILTMWQDDSTMDSGSKSADFNSTSYMAIKGFQDRLLDMHIKSKSKLLPEIATRVSKLFLWEECAFFLQLISDAKRAQSLSGSVVGQPSLSDVHYQHAFYPFSGLQSHHQAKMFLMLKDTVQGDGPDIQLQYGRILMKYPNEKYNKVARGGAGSKQAKSTARSEPAQMPAEAVKVADTSPNSPQTPPMALTVLMGMLLNQQEGSPEVLETLSRALQIAALDPDQKDRLVPDLVKMQMSLLMAAQTQEQEAVKSLLAAANMYDQSRRSYQSVIKNVKRTAGVVEQPVKDYMCAHGFINNIGHNASISVGMGECKLPQYVEIAPSTQAGYPHTPK